MLAILREITKTISDFSHKIMKNRENCHSWNSRFPQMVKREITFALHSRKIDPDPSLHLPEIVVDGILGQFDCKFSNRK